MFWGKTNEIPVENPMKYRMFGGKTYEIPVEKPMKYHILVEKTYEIPYVWGKNYEIQFNILVEKNLWNTICLVEKPMK